MTLIAVEPKMCRRGLAALLWFVCLGALGCTAPQQRTILTVDDYEHVSSELAQKLQDSEFLRDRTVDSPRIIIAIRKVVNLTSDVIPTSAQWYMVARMVDSLPMAELRADKNLAFMVPAERLREARKHGDCSDALPLDGSATHTMLAEFRSMTRTADRARTDMYYCPCRIVDLATGEEVWTGKVEFKKAAEGRSWD